MRGVTGFYPRNFKNNPHMPKVIIKRLEVLDKPFKSDTAISLVRKVELPYNQNTIAIEYVPLEFTNPLKNKVQYMLEGVDEDWLMAGNQSVARYTNLRPGNYTFKVKACNNDEVWNMEPTTLQIVIKIPFWQSLWFRFLLLLLILGIAYYFSALYLDYKIRNEKLKLEKEQAVDQERARISSDMHDDLGSGLSTIRLLSEIAKRKIKEPGQTKEIERISEAAGELVDKMSEIIWAMNSSNDSLANLIAYMRSFAADFLEHAHIEHHFIIPDNIPTSSSARHPPAHLPGRERVAAQRGEAFQSHRSDHRGESFQEYDHHDQRQRQGLRPRKGTPVRQRPQKHREADAAGGRAGRYHLAKRDDSFLRYTIKLI